MPPRTGASPSRTLKLVSFAGVVDTGESRCGVSPHLLRRVVYAVLRPVKEAFEPPNWA